MQKIIAYIEKVVCPFARFTATIEKDILKVNIYPLFNTNKEKDSYVEINIVELYKIDMECRGKYIEDILRGLINKIIHIQLPGEKI